MRGRFNTTTHNPLSFRINAVVLTRHATFLRSLYAKSTAERNMLSFTSIYRCVVLMFKCPAKLINTRTPTPLAARLVMNVRRPEWLLPPAMPADFQTDLWSTRQRPPPPWTKSGWWSGCAPDQCPARSPVQCLKPQFALL